MKFALLNGWQKKAWYLLTLISLVAKEAGINVEWGAKVPELIINKEVVINVEGGIFWKKLVHKLQ